jgi:hypothetical protein
MPLSDNNLKHFFFLSKISKTSKAKSAGSPVQNALIGGDRARSGQAGSPPLIVDFGSFGPAREISISF